MNILILNWRDISHPLAGGAEISLFEHAKYWHKKGAKVIWFASYFPGGRKEEDIEGIKIMRAGSHYSVHLFAFLYYMLRKLGKPDIIIDCFHFLPFFSIFYFKKAKIIALINEVAGKVWFSNIPFPFSLVGYLIEPFFFIFYRKNQFITSSESTKNELIRFGIPSKNINMVFHGVTVKKMNDNIIKEKNPTIIFLGRISEDKGIKDALYAFKKLCGKIGNLKFWIVGKEEEKGYLNSLMQNSNLDSCASQIKYFYYVDENKKFELLKKAWILIHPSRKEGWGLNIIEAGSQGTPAVGYNTEGLRDSILHEKTGLLCASNFNSLADAIFRIVSDKKLYNKLADGALSWARRFNWKKSNSGSFKILENTLINT